MRVVSRSLCLALSLVLALPPRAALLAQEGLGGPTGPRVGATVLDRSGLDVLDVEPLSGALIYAHVDLELGDGPAAFRLVRTYRPWAGDALNTGLHWVSALDLHLDVHRSGEMATFVDEDGYRHQLRPGSDGVLTAVAGRPATVVETSEGYVLRGLGDERVYLFDREGWPISRGGPEGVAIVYQYDPAGGAERRLARVRGPWGDVVLERDERGALVAVTPPSGQRVVYERDRAGNLARVGLGELFESYGYDAAGRLASVAEGGARVTYDALGRVRSLSGSGIRTTTVRYLRTDDGDRALQAFVERGGRTQVHALSRDGRRVERTDEDGLTAVTYLDERDRPVRFVAPDGREWTRHHDAEGRLLRSSAPEGETRFEYASPATHRPTRILHADGRETAFAYDADGDLLSVTASGGAVTRFGYDGRGRLASTTSPRGAVTRFTRDERGHVTRVDEEGVGATEYVRDAAGLVTRVRRPDGRTVDVTRDASGRARRVAEGSGAPPATGGAAAETVLREVDFDARGRVTRHVDELGQALEYRWNDLGELVSVRDTRGDGVAVAAFEYDPAGRLAALVDALGNRTAYERPDARTLVVRDPARGTTVLRRDALGRLAEETRGAGTDGAVTLRYAYDAQGNLVGRDTPAGRETFTYDARGRVTSLRGPDGGLELAYDEAGRLARLRDATLGQGVEYGYDAAGDRSELRLPWGTVRYEHDVQGRVTGLVLPDGGRIEVALRRDGQRREVRYPSGAVTRFAYDEAARLTEVVTARGEETLDARRYGHDARGRVAWVEEGTGPDAPRTTFERDALGRLTRMSRGPRVHHEGGQEEVNAPDEIVAEWAYDAAGTLVGARRPGQAERRGEVGPGNRLTRIAGAGALGYGPTGALTSLTGPEANGPTTRYAYDHDDRLVRVEGAGGATVRYGYAPNGTRLWRVGPDGRTSYLYDLANLVGELGPDGALRTAYYHGPGVDDVLAAGHGGETFALHRDALGSVTSITGRDARVAAKYAYGPLGDERLAQGEAAAWNHLRFTARPYDEATGLYDFRARQYSPSLGRFTTPDPLGPWGGLNAYAYAHGDPTTFTDPFGLDPERRPWYERLWSKTRDVASSVGNFTVAFGETLADDFTSGAMGRRLVAFGRGFGKGAWAAGKGVVSTLVHPVDTANGIVYAARHWDETKESLLARWEEYKDAAVNDPERFAEMTGTLTAEVVVSIAGTKGLDKLGKANTLARLGTNLARAGRVAGSPVTRLAGRVGTSLATRFPRVAATLRRSTVLTRARDLELLRRAAAPGNVLARAGRRVVDFGRDLGRGASLAWREPGAFLAYGGRRLAGTAAAIVASTGRGTWTATRRFGLPAVLGFDDAITDAIAGSATHEAAVDAVRGRAERFLADAPGLTAEAMVERVNEVGLAYRDYRNRLLAPVHEDDRRMAAALEDLNARVERGEVPPEAVDARVRAVLEELGRRRLDHMTALYDRNADAPHDMFRPSPNRIVSFQDELALLAEAKRRVTDPRAAALLDARIADLEALMAHELALFRAGEHDALIAGIAGPPRTEELPPGTTSPAPEPGEGELPFEDDVRGLSSTLDGLIDPPARREGPPPRER